MPFKIIRKVLCLGLITVLVWGGPVATLLAKPTNYPPLLIGPGDHLSILVYNHSSAPSAALAQGKMATNGQLPSDYLVDADGKIFFPFLHEVKISGMSPEQASELLMKKLGKYIEYPQVTVLISNSANYKVSVLGEVNHPGKFMIEGDPSLVSILAQAGGPSKDADLGGAVIIHGKKKSRFNLNDYLRNENYKGDEPLLYPGDVLMVPKSGLPSIEEWAVIASILSTAAVVFVTVYK